MSVEKLNTFSEIKGVVSEYLKKKRVGKSWQKVEGRIGRDSSNRMKMKFSTNSRSGKYSCLYIKPLSKTDFIILLKTGRMHQIRATLNYLGYSIVGDGLYGDSASAKSDRIDLESVVLSFREKGGRSKTWELI
jgi:23S rRNA-/tRNA-specific pseudouridylate synthase